jgi:hypothetical protein
MKTTKEIRNTPQPIKCGEHWNCGVCGGSHKFYCDAVECMHSTEFYNQKWYSEEEVEEIFKKFDEYANSLKKEVETKKNKIANNVLYIDNTEEM